MTFKLKSLIAASAVAIAAATSAQAADVVAPHQPMKAAPVIAPEFSWDGFYAGANLGGTFGKNTLIKGEAETKANTKGFLAGLYAGYNFNLGQNLVLGAETDFAMAKADKKVDNDKGYVNEKWLGATRARLGYNMGHFLPYIAGGVAYTKVDSSLTNKDAAEGKTLKGWTAGVGADYAMTKNVALRLEYRRNDFGKKDIDANPAFKLKHQTNDIRVGVSYKF